MFFSLWDRWKGLFVQPPFLFFLFVFSLHLDGHKVFFPTPFVSFPFVYLFILLLMLKQMKNLLVQPPFSLMFFSFFFVSLLLRWWKVFFSRPLPFFPFFSFSWDNNVIFAGKGTSSFVTKLHKVAARSQLGPYKRVFFFVLTHKINPNWGTTAS